MVCCYMDFNVLWIFNCSQTKFSNYISPVVFLRNFFAGLVFRLTFCPRKRDKYYPPSPPISTHVHRSTRNPARAIYCDIRSFLDFKEFELYWGAVFFKDLSTHFPQSRVRKRCLNQNSLF